ncbi:MAG: hypothetical protein JWR27_587 [Aeromicrobium sp.]|nr:hypothetical protein [Aeromicrobium sp.]
MIGYYVHHHGRGHLHRAMVVAAQLSVPVTGLSSLPRPAGWDGPWVQLPRDDARDTPTDPDAHGRLHWVPTHDPGLRDRMAAIARWIEAAQPALLMVDVSIEVLLLARLHGVPVVTMVLPGDRRDAGHVLAHGVAERVLAVWPPDAGEMVAGIPHGVDVHRVGALSRFDTRIGESIPRPSGAHRRVVVLAGAGGSDLTPRDVAEARAQTPDWHWDVLDAHSGGWVEDPWPLLRSADVIITHAGQNALAEVAAARRPAIVIPQTRPHAEQVTTARVLGRSSRWPASVHATFASLDWAVRLSTAAMFAGEDWSGWNDGHAAERLAAVLEQKPGRHTSQSSRPMSQATR